MSLALAALALAPAVAGCALEPSDLASFLDTPFGEVSADVTTLRDDEVGAVMTDLMLRFRSYLALREIVPITALARPDCMSDAAEGLNRVSFTADVNCVFGDDHAPADGAIHVAQRRLADEPPVTELVIDYDQVRVGALEVDGRERIEETDAPNGASVRRLDLVQGGYRFDYDFRLGQLDGEVPVFDYLVDTAHGGAIARVTNPTSSGGFVTVILIGLDGSLECEVRDTAWAPGEAARGLCDNGVVFGLPE